MVESYRSYIDGASNGRKLRQLWPIVEKTLNWPTPIAFRDDEVDTLAFEWVEKEWGVRGLPGRPCERDVLKLMNWIVQAVRGGNEK